jgi:hypothetical protein
MATVGVVGVVTRLIVGAIAAGAVVVEGVVDAAAREVIGAVRGGSRAAVVVVSVVARRIVSPAGGRPPAAAMVVMGIVPRRIIVPAPHHADLGPVIPLVVNPMARRADRRERHSSLHRFQDETPLNPFTVCSHDGISRVSWVVFPLLPHPGRVGNRAMVRHESVLDRSSRPASQAHVISAMDEVTRNPVATEEIGAGPESRVYAHLS